MLRAPRTCISGRDCELRGLLGQHLSAADRLAVLSTCGGEGGALPHAAGPVALAPADSGAASAALAALTAAGGEYRLCWCGGGARPCAEAGDFKVDLGAFHVVGVAPLAQDTSVAPRARPSATWSARVADEASAERATMLQGSSEARL